MKIRAIIWYKDYERGLKQLLQIKENYKLLEIYPKQIRDKFIQFDNDDIWELADANFPHLGKRCHISYIQRGIDAEIVDNCISPCTIAQPFQAFYYYGYFD